MRHFTPILILLSCLRVDAEIVVAGSDLLADIVGTPLELFSDSTGIRVTVDMDGTMPAERAFANDEADLIIVADPGGEYTAPEGTLARPLTFLIAVVATHEENPLEEISLEQLRGIFAEGTPSRIERWSDLGVQGMRASGNLRPIVLDEPDLILKELFRATALERAQLRNEVELIRSLPNTVEIISSDVNAMAILPQAPSVGATKTLRVSGGGDGEFAFDPDADNVFYASYPLRLPFYIVFREEDRGLLADLVQLLYSQEFTEVLEDNGFIALPSNLRQRMVLELTAAP